MNNERAVKMLERLRDDAVISKFVTVRECQAYRSAVEDMLAMLRAVPLPDGPNGDRKQLHDMLAAAELMAATGSSAMHIVELIRANLKDMPDGPSSAPWRKCGPGDAECKGVHFMRAEAAAGGDICVTAMYQGEFYEYRVKVPPFDASPFATGGDS